MQHISVPIRTSIICRWNIICWISLQEPCCVARIGSADEMAVTEQARYGIFPTLFPFPSTAPPAPIDLLILSILLQLSANVVSLSHRG